MNIILPIVIIVAFIIGMVINFIKPTPMKKINHLRYFTILSNIMVFIIVTLSLIPMIKDEKWLYILTFISTINIIVTNFGFHFLIRYGIKRTYKKTGIRTYNPNTIDNILLHYVVPFVMVLYYVTFYNHNYLNYWFLLIAIIAPSIYLIIALIMGEISKPFINPSGDLVRYPYFFIDKDAIGIFKGGTENAPIGIVQFIILFLLFVVLISLVIIIIL